MPESELIERTGATPPTVSSLRSDLARLGVSPGMVLMVHSSLRALGWVVGGAQAVVRALEEALGPEGTLVMPAHSYGLSDPEGWRNPPVPAAWWEVIRAELPPFDSDLTPTTGMGAIAECFRKQSGTVRSTHPIISVAARGPLATFISAPEPLGPCHGEGSPLARLYDAHAWVLLLGVGHGCNTSLHLAERRSSYAPKATVVRRLLTESSGHREWVTFEDVDGRSDDFEVVGAAFARDTGLARCGSVGRADAILVPQRDLVDYAVAWFQRNRGVSP